MTKEQRPKQDCTCADTCARRGKPFPSEWPWLCQGFPYVPTELDMHEKKIEVPTSKTITDRELYLLTECMTWQSCSHLGCKARREIERLRPMAESWESYEAAQERKAATQPAASNHRLTDEQLDQAIKLASGFDHIPMALLWIHAGLRELKERRASETFELRPVPTGWIRGMKDTDTPNGPGEWNVDFSYGDDRPDGDGWVPLYSKPPHIRPAVEPKAQCAYIGAPQGTPQGCTLSAGHSGPHSHGVKATGHLSVQRAIGACKHDFGPDPDPDGTRCLKGCGAVYQQ